MLTHYIRSSRTLEDIRASGVGPYLDDLTSTMAGDGFAASTVAAHVRTVAQLGRWAQRRGIALARWDDCILEGFRRHLVRRRFGECDRAVGHAVHFCD
jgi:hypothetical protein